MRCLTPTPGLCRACTHVHTPTRLQTGGGEGLTSECAVSSYFERKNTERFGAGRLVSPLRGLCKSQYPLGHIKKKSSCPNGRKASEWTRDSAGSAPAATSCLFCPFDSLTKNSLEVNVFVRVFEPFECSHSSILLFGFFCFLFLICGLTRPYAQSQQRQAEDSPLLPTTSTPYFTTTALFVWLNGRATCDGSCESARFFFVCRLFVVFSRSTGTRPGSDELKYNNICVNRVVAVLQFECFVCEAEFLLENLPRHIFLGD